MNQLQTFNHSIFGEIGIASIDGKEHFGATQAAMTLGYSNPHDALLRHCKKDGVVKHEVIDKLGRKQEMNLISEGNLYRLISRSKLPGAEKFESWVFDEVLPSIRKHGAYLTPEKVEEALLNPDTLIQLATQLKKERAEREKLEEQSNVDRPKVIFADAVSASKTTILIADLAKLLKQNGYNTGQQRLFEELRQQGYLIKRKGADYNSPTQRSMDLGLFEVKETAITHSDGHVSISKTTKVTGKGQQYFINKYLSENVRGVLNATSS